MVVPWIISLRLDRKLKTIYNLVIQAAVYFIWKERNSRLHNQTSKPAHSVVKDIYLLLRGKLYSLDIEQRALPSATQRNLHHSTMTTYLSLWFERVQVTFNLIKNAIINTYFVTFLCDNTSVSTSKRQEIIEIREID
ncbi:hypothetical protein Bca101_092907 [Brassica carinata]